MRIYLAAPFFNEAQLEVVRRLEELVERTGNQLYSPRRDGVLSAMTLEERVKSKRKIFETNCKEICEANMILAVVDGRDQGVTWEIGYAYGLSCGSSSLLIVTYTDQDYGLNVMIQECVDAHCRGMKAAEEILRAANGRADDLFKAFARHRDFDPRVT